MPLLRDLLGSLTGAGQVELDPISGTYKPKNRFFDYMFAEGQGGQMAQRANIQSQMQKAQQDREFADRMNLQKQGYQDAYNNWVRQQALEAGAMPGKLKAENEAKLELESKLADQKAALEERARQAAAIRLGQAARISREGWAPGLGDPSPEYLEGFKLQAGQDLAKGAEGTVGYLGNKSKADFYASAPGQSMLSDINNLAALDTRQLLGSTQKYGQAAIDARMQMSPEQLLAAQQRRKFEEQEFGTPKVSMGQGYMTVTRPGNVDVMPFNPGGSPGYVNGKYVLSTPFRVGMEERVSLVPQKILEDAKSFYPETGKREVKTETSPRAPLLSAMAPAPSGITPPSAPAAAPVLKYPELQYPTIGSSTIPKGTASWILGGYVPPQATVRSQLPSFGYRDELNPDAALMYQANPPKLQNFMGLSPEDFQRVRRIYSRE